MKLTFKDNRDAPALERTPPNTPAVTVTGTARCGHPEDKLGPPKFRASMLANIASRDCPACRKARHDSEKQAARERKKDPEWIAAQAAKKQLKSEARYGTRLPDGARFDATYDAASKTWTGTLAIGTDTIRATCSGIFGLMRELDRSWRSSAGIGSPAHPASVPVPDDANDRA